MFNSYFHFAGDLPRWGVFEEDVTLLRQKPSAANLSSKIVVHRDRSVEVKVLGEYGRLRIHVRRIVPGTTGFQPKATLLGRAMPLETLLKIAAYSDLERLSRIRVNLVDARPGVNPAFYVGEAYFYHPGCSLCPLNVFADNLQRYALLG